MINSLFNSFFISIIYKKYNKFDCIHESSSPKSPYFFPVNSTSSKNFSKNDESSCMHLLIFSSSTPDFLRTTLKKSLNCFFLSVSFKSCFDKLKRNIRIDRKNPTFRTNGTRIYRKDNNEEVDVWKYSDEPTSGSWD